MAAYGRIEEFHPSKGTSWQQYNERLNFFFVANDITEDVKKRAVFLSVCGPALYSIIRSLCTPQTPSEVDYAVIIAKLTTHFSPVPSEILSRYKFHKRDQSAQESVAEYLAEIRRLSEHCNFGTQLDSMLRDRLVCGLRDENIQRRLLANPLLTLNIAMDEALSGEAASRHALEIRGISNSSDVHYVKPKSQPSQDKQTWRKNKTCYRCGAIHPQGECKFIEATCYFCKKKGHIAKVCNKKKRIDKFREKKSTGNKLHLVEETDKDNTVYEHFHKLNHFGTVVDVPPHDVTLNLNGLSHTMEIDSGSLHSVISTQSYSRLWPVNSPQLLPVTDQLLRTWSSEKLDVKGYIQVIVSYQSTDSELPLLVVQGKGKSLIGRSWFKALNIKVQIEHFPLQQIVENSVEALLQKYSAVFSKELGTFKGPPVSINIDEHFIPKFIKARPVPFALRERVTQELEAMEKKGILEATSYSDWATPVVPVVKKNGSIRICGDYRSTVNQAVKQFTYPLPTVNEVLSTVSGGTVFSKLDLSEAYLQVRVDEAASKVLTLNTHKGLFRVKRLPFGVSVAVSVFQKKIEEILSGIEGVLPYLDDIFIKGQGISSHNQKLEQVLERLEREGIRLRREKCQFLVPEIELLGFRVNAKGIQPTSDKVTAIHQAPTPTNKVELQAFLGMINFYGCFLKNRSDVMEPLHRLLQKDVPWSWTHSQDEAYKAAKKLLQEDKLLVHYSGDLPIILTCDASSYGLGAVLSHKMADGREAPIAYYSRTMASAERNYSQTDKEALSILAAVKKFHQYLFGRKFTIVTDHKPLLGLLNPTKPLPQMVSPRVLRWSLSLSAYDYEIEYRQGKCIVNADALSRLPVATAECDIPAPADVLMLESVTDTNVDAKLIASATQKDPILSRVTLWILNGWPEKSPDERFTPYYRRQNELSVHQNCILWGSRVIIPDVMKKKVLTLLHGSHPGIVRMKGLARSYVWWPNLDSEIETTVKMCTTCQEHQRSPSKAPVHPWEWTERPWSRLHIDFAGPYHGQTFFLVVDSHSKWLEVILVSSMSPATIISKMRSLFATHGVPDVVVSDNGGTFISQEFKDFLEKNQIRQIFVAPHHPSSNGQAERMVDTTKQALKKIIQGNWQARLARFLFSQHILPCTATGKSPAELLMNRRLSSLLDRLHPDLNKTMKGKKTGIIQSQKKVRIFQPGNKVYIRNYSSGPPWIPAEILEVTGPLSYRLRTSEGLMQRRHVDQIRECFQTHQDFELTTPILTPKMTPRCESEFRVLQEEPSPDITPQGESEPEVTQEEPVPAEQIQLPCADLPETVPREITHPSPGLAPSTVRRSGRATRRPNYLNDYVSYLKKGGVLCPHRERALEL